MPTLLEHAQHHNTWPGLGASETPEIRALPWARGPSVKDLAKRTRIERLGTVATLLGVVGGVVGLYVSLRALGAFGKRKRS